MCELCGNKLKRNGTTTAGTTRWRCTTCGASSTKRRPDLRRRGELNEFRAWLLNPTPQGHTPAAARAFRRRTAWCWLIEPTITVTGELYSEVQVDGLYLSSRWCLLVASHHGKVVAWQWCDREKTVAWKALLTQVPPPRVLVCDGGSGIPKAVQECWPDARIQRCLVHVQRVVRRHLTSRPRTEAGKALWALARSLTKVNTRAEATTWLQALNAWHQTHGHLTRERTYLKNLGHQAAPSWVRQGQRWWYTHERLRRAYRGLAKLVREQQLFVYLEPEFAGLKISSTTNSIEGAINAQIRRMLSHHRGMIEHHQRRAIEWWLHDHAIAAPHPNTLIPAHLDRPKVTSPVATNEPIGPAGYDTALTAEEGLWARKGWAGRS